MAFFSLKWLFEMVSLSVAADVVVVLAVVVVVAAVNLDLG